MATILRPYQEEIKSKIYKAWGDGHKNVLAVLPTGGGKTRIFCNIAMDFAVHPKDKLPTAIVVHRKELVQQISLTLAEEGVTHNIIAPRNVILGIVAAQRQEFKKQFYDYSAPVSVISVDTLNARILKHADWAKKIRFWIVDEATHLLKDNKWGRAVGYFPDAIGLGVTATPERLDGKGLGSHVEGVFDVLVEGPKVKWMIQNGFLSRYKVAVPHCDYQTYLKKANSTSDFSKKAMTDASRESNITGDVVENYLRFAEGKQAIVFATDIKTAEEMETNFKSEGIEAKLLTGNSTDKERLDGMISFREKETKVLINVDLFDEGLDCFSEDTEILTPNGWQNYESMVNQETCYAWNPDTERIEVASITRCFSRELRDDEKFLTIKSQHTNVKITENHNIYYRKKDYYTENFRTVESYVSKAKDIFGYERPFSVPVSGEMDFKGIDLTDDELSLLGWAFTDAWLEGGNLIISQSKPKMVRKIRELLGRLGYSYRETVKSAEELNTQKNRRFLSTLPSFRFSLHVNDRWKEIRYLYNKKDLRHELHNMTRRQFKILWDAMMDGNGSIPGGEYNKTGRLCMVGQTMVDFLSHLAVTRGYALSYGTYTTNNGVTVYDIGLRDKTYIQLCQRDKRGAKFKLAKPEVKEKVWCVTNSLGTVITRRKGKITILGNCPGIECVIMARPTMSFGKYRQCVGRGLRPDPNKEFLVLIDHVGNVIRHGLPCAKADWSLERRVRRQKKVELMRICENPVCASPFERELTECPWCGTEVFKRAGGGGRIPPELVDGDLFLMDPETLNEIEESTELEDPADVGERVASVAGMPAGLKARRDQIERINTQSNLSECIAKLAGIQRDQGMEDRSIHKLFFITYGKTISQALAEKRADMLKTIELIEREL